MVTEKSVRKTKKSIVASDTTIKKSEKREDEVKKSYTCCKCRHEYEKQDTNFPASQSELYAGLDYHLPICKKCLDNLFKHYTEVYGNDEDRSVKRLCELFDIYFNESLLNASRKITKNRSRISTYISRSNLQQYKDKTYDTYLDEQTSKELCEYSEDELNNMEEEKRIGLENNTKLWGSDYTDAEYEFMNNHYNLLTKQIDTVDFVQETLIRDLCGIKVQQVRARKSNDLDKYTKLIDLYQKTLTSAKLKPNTGVTVDGENDSYGSWLSQIETYTPAEYYKDKNKYRDFFGIEEYIQRFLYRPLKNLLSGSKEMDKEYKVDGDDNE